MPPFDPTPAEKKKNLVAMNTSVRKVGQVKKFASAAQIDKKQGIKTASPKPKGSLEQYLQYPADIGASNRTANYILFTTYKRHPAKFSQSAAQRAKIAGIGKDADFGVKPGHGARVKAAQKSAADGFEKANALSNAKGVPGSESLHMKQGHSKSGTTIALYMPPTVNAKYNMEYDNAPIGFVSEAIYSIIKDIQAGAAWDEAAKKGGGTLGTGLTQMGLKMLDTVVPGAKDLVAMERGHIIAPRTEVMFQGITKRTFSFNFTFIPKSKRETETIDKIIYEFKRAMTPAFKDPNSVRELNFPEMFAIAYMHMNNENQYLNKIGKCFLESCDVSYGGERFVTFEDTGKGAPPNKITMALSFREIEIVEQSKIDQGY